MLFIIGAVSPSPTISECSAFRASLSLPRPPLSTPNLLHPLYPLSKELFKDSPPEVLPSSLEYLLPLRRKPHFSSVSFYSYALSENQHRLTPAQPSSPSPALQRYLYVPRILLLLFLHLVRFDSDLIVQALSKGPACPQQSGAVSPAFTAFINNPILNLLAGLTSAIGNLLKLLGLGSSTAPAAPDPQEDCTRPPVSS